MNRFVKCEPILKGWSDDKKYCAETAAGERFLLRVSDIEEYDRKKNEYEMLERAYKLGVPTPEPVGFGICNDGKNVYQLTGWIDGVDLRDVLPDLSDAEKYVYGVKSGGLLRKIHSVPAPADDEPVSVWFDRKVRERIELYNAKPIKTEGGDLIVRYLAENKSVLDGRTKTLNHGDFNISNTMLTADRQVAVIDFNAYNGCYGDPWWEFDPLIDGWGSEVCAHYFTGVLKGYFVGEPPADFFNVFAYYQAYCALAALCDTSEHNQGEPEEGRRYLENTLRWFDNMQNPVPEWYLGDFYVQLTDGVPYKLKSPFDFSFLGKYGKLFKVFDDQDSGNICFGVQGENGKLFVKYAGAPTVRANVDEKEAVDRMKETVQIYNDLAHPNLTRLIKSEEIGGGFACVFNWTNAECMGRQYPETREKFMQMAVETKLRVLDDIFSFHLHVINRGYVAVDFYDGCIMYDFESGKTLICDIELYTKMPCKNTMGRMYGSSRFMSPEEFKLGEPIDELTNVYTMGAAAFELFCGERCRSFEKWALDKSLYDIAKKAVSDERSMRHRTLEEFVNEWNKARAQIGYT